jgi:hypothetical protein
MLVTRLDLITSSQMVWNYFDIGHGKGKVDGVGVLLKREVKGTNQAHSTKSSECC